MPILDGLQRDGHHLYRLTLLHLSLLLTAHTGVHTRTNTAHTWIRIRSLTFRGPCIVTCDRASWHVTVYRDMWPCIVTCDRASWYILTTKPTRCTNFSNLFLEYNSTYFGQFLRPSSGVQYCIHSNRYMSYRLCWLSASGIRMERAVWHAHCCVYSTGLLMMDGGTVRNM